MKKMSITLLAATLFLQNKASSQTLKDVTFGFAAGPAYRFTKAYDYSLSPDGTSSLKIQDLSNFGFVVSSTITVKFKKLKVDSSGKEKFLLQKTDDKAEFKDRLALVVGLNLLEVKNDVKFNQSVDGGIGLGYFIHENTSIAFMLDIATLRQMRQYLVNLYENKPIPKGNEFYNALDATDNNLFYNKTIIGTSLKVVFSF